MAVPLRRELQSPVRFADYSLALTAILISLIGVAMNYSATWRILEFNGSDGATYAKRQALFVMAGAVAMILSAAFSYRSLRSLANSAYLLSLAALIGVLFVGVERNGARAWFEVPGLPFQLQPSEFAKLTVILALAAFVATHESYLRLSTLVNAFLLIAVPLGLIYRQPDLGTMLVFVSIGMGMLLISGAQVKHIVITSLLGIIAIFLLLNLDAFGGPSLLRQTQENRLTAFLDPAYDPQGASYNLRQSEIAIGAGGVKGQGWLKGSQTNLNLVPEQKTDFIFTALGEEFGFLGCSILLLLYAYLLARIWWIARMSSDLFGSFICVGVLSMFAFQIFQNVGMTMGIMPITGIPLPFMSHGGSSTVMAFLSIGLVVNVGARRYGGR
jgi:rod shape determining protein RodA